MKEEHILMDISNIDVNFEMFSSDIVKLGDLIKLKKGDMFVLSNRKVKLSYPGFGELGEGTLVAMGGSIAIVFDEIFPR